VTMNESRQELLSWLNSLLDLRVTKIEQCGTGAALCQVFDSIYRDVPMSRVKFGAKGPYDYFANFKILQGAFKRHDVDRIIPIQALVKCRMQDNLEFLQWMKKYWDLNAPDHDYDPIARRKGGDLFLDAIGRVRTTVPSAVARKGRTTPSSRPHVVKPAGPGNTVLQQENAALKETVSGLERERDFYFSKLRDIELLIQQAVEDDPELEKQEDGLIKHIQTILYSTEEGFEIPVEAEGLDDQETF